MSLGEDDFVVYGHALEPLDEENLPRKKPITIEDQFAYDTQGRRRFHGAFTGGFSAGYFNTVGTRDGWKPQQFKSTRSSKADNVVQRPEDFMDEEDTGEFGIAPIAIRATQGYSDGKGTKRERKHDSGGPIPGTPVLNELLQPVKERVGVTLLKKMGWKPGQGVGPRLTKKEKKQQRKHLAKVKVYSCSLPSQTDQQSESETESSDDEFVNITFAPDDYEPYRCNPKDNYFGIGYSGLDRRPVLSQHINLFDSPAFSVQDKNKKLSIRGQAFGVGAFEDEDDDIYAIEDMSRYDFSTVSERKSKSRWSEVKKLEPDCIEGFIPCKVQLPQKKIFLVPIIPKDFQPVHIVRKSRFSPLTEENSQQSRRPHMNAESRAKIVNDDRPSIIDSKTPSVANQIISRSLNLFGKEQVTERQKIEQERSKKTSMSWLDKLSSTSFVKGETIGTDPNITGSLQDASTFVEATGKTELNEKMDVLKPTFADLNKQHRFEQYLKYTESERKLKFASHQPLSMTDWEREKEDEEFERAAKICVHIDNTFEIEQKETVKKKEANAKVNLDSLGELERMKAAAKMKMFGKLTRSIKEWKPAKLVCNRFNIAEPSVGVAETDKKKKKFSIFDSVTWKELSKFQKGANLEYETDLGPSTSNSSFSTKKSKEVFEVPVIVSKHEKSIEESYCKNLEKEDASSKDDKDKKSENETEIDDFTTLTADMNRQEKVDLFKSIFLSSSEESESEAEEQLDEDKLKTILLGNNAAKLNVERNTSPPRGIFAKLDLDNLMKQPEKLESINEKVERLSKESSKLEDSTEKSIKQNLPLDAYGPILPEAFAINTASKKPLFLSLSKKVIKSKEGVWVEKKEKKRSKKEKKKHKHKERSKSKSRKKSKKEKKH